MGRPYEDLVLDEGTGDVSEESLAAALAMRGAERENAIKSILAGDYEIVDQFDD